MATKAKQAKQAKANGKKAPVKKAPVKASTKPKQAPAKKATPSPTPVTEPALKPTTAPTSARSLTPGQRLTKTFRSGGTHTATVQPDGRTIRYEGQDYTSVSSVATAMILRETGHEGSANGWAFFGLEQRPSNTDPVGTFTKAADALYARAERLVLHPSEGSIDAVVTLARKLEKLLA